MFDVTGVHFSIRDSLAVNAFLKESWAFEISKGGWGASGFPLEIPKGRGGIGEPLKTEIPGGVGGFKTNCHPWGGGGGGGYGY